MNRKRLSSAQMRIIAALQDYKCKICLQLLPAQWCADHIVPLHLNGSNQLLNFQLLCPNCHAKKTQHEMINWHQDTITSPYFSTLAAKPIPLPNKQIKQFIEKRKALQDNPG